MFFDHSKIKFHKHKKRNYYKWIKEIKKIKMTLKTDFQAFFDSFQSLKRNLDKFFLEIFWDNA